MNSGGWYLLRRGGVAHLPSQFKSTRRTTYSFCLVAMPKPWTPAPAEAQRCRTCSRLLEARDATAQR